MNVHRFAPSQLIIMPLAGSVCVACLISAYHFCIDLTPGITQGVEAVRGSGAASAQEPPSARSATAAAPPAPAQDVDMDSLGDSLLADEALPPAQLDGGGCEAAAAWSHQAAAVPAPLWEQRPSPAAAASPAQAPARAATALYAAVRSPLAAPPQSSRLQLLTPPVRASPGAYCWA